METLTFIIAIIAGIIIGIIFTIIFLRQEKERRRNVY